MGVATIMNPVYNKVLDVFPMSKYCQKCKMNEEVRARNQCDYNFPVQDSSGSMEVYGVVEMFKRSVQERGLKYLQFLGDGDSKAFNTVCNLKVYGCEQIVKLECVNHFSKRFGRGMENFIKNLKAKGIKLDGKGKITGKFIDRLQSYYRNAIRANYTSIDDMKNSIWATFYHYTSTDQQPNHIYCPRNSWCVYNLDKRPSDFSHKKYINKQCPPNIFEKTREFYEKMTQNYDLDKLKHGRTTNCSESFNSKIWKRAPKSTYTGFDGLKIAVYDSVLCHNHGYITRSKVIEKFGFSTGKNTVEGLIKMDKLRINNKNNPKVLKRKYRTVETSN
jgi:hypothetical protein